TGLFSCKSPDVTEKSYVRSISDRVARWQIAHQPEVMHHDLDWTNGAWYRGLAEWAQVTGNEEFFIFLKNQGEKNNWDVYYRLHHADDICVSQTWILLAERSGDDSVLERTVQRLDSARAFPSTAPLMKNHPLGRDERWSWCDALFMAPPVYAAMYLKTGKKEYLDFMEREFVECTDSLYHPDYKLYYRDCTKRELREPNGEHQFWARGNGWVFAGIPVLMDIMPADYEKKDYFLHIFLEMAQAVVDTQDEAGSWHASLLDPETYFQPENSASGFFCYGLLWGVRNGILDKDTYLPPALKAWEKLCSHVADDGKLGYIQPVGNAPKPADEHTTDIYGTGAFLLAASEMLRVGL
ncbi:MAG: glycoside hydrolase family 88 protein, partial [Bacteroides sp.]|nr:glycoside hydrolase family 88 protein [Bacteroides sp.]